MTNWLEKSSKKLIVLCCTEYWTPLARSRSNQIQVVSIQPGLFALKANSLVVNWDRSNGLGGWFCLVLFSDFALRARANQISIWSKAKIWFDLISRWEAFILNKSCEPKRKLTQSIPSKVDTLFIIKVNSRKETKQLNKYNDDATRRDK